MNKSDSIKNIAVALAKFNGEVRMIEKDARNPHFKSEYSTLDNIVAEVRPILQKHGLSILQFPSGDGEVVSTTTMLLHESGEWIESPPVTMKPSRNDPQGVGSAITYSRRYGLAALLSLALGDDDDANAASTPPQVQQSRPAQSPRQETSEQQNSHSEVAMISSKQIGLIKVLAGKKKVKIDELLRGKSIEGLTMEQAKRTIDHLNGLPEPQTVGAQPSLESDLPF